MNVAWCMMALALSASDDGSPGEAGRADSPIAIQIKTGRPADQANSGRILIEAYQEHEPYVLGEVRVKGDARSEEKGTPPTSRDDRVDVQRSRRQNPRGPLPATVAIAGVFPVRAEWQQKTKTESANDDRRRPTLEKLCESVAQATWAAIQMKPAADPVSQAVAAFIKHDPSSCVAPSNDVRTVDAGRQVLLHRRPLQPLVPRPRKFGP